MRGEEGMPKYIIRTPLLPDQVIQICRRHITANIVSTEFSPEGFRIEFDRELTEAEIHVLAFMMNAFISSEDGKLLSSPNEAYLWILKNTRIDLTTGYIILPI